MSSPAATPNSPRPSGSKFDRFWQRVTEGMELHQLWTQFRSDTRASYRFYSKEIDSSKLAGLSRGRRFLYITEQFFWAILSMLTPVRRIILLVALVLLMLGGGYYQGQNSHANGPGFYYNGSFFGGVLLFALLMLEIGDRVVMKRDLQIAKEIQQWLLPATPPVVPGCEVAFTTRAANTVAGDFYDVFPRTGDNSSWLIAVADVAGKSMPAALLMASFQASLKTLSTTNASMPNLAAAMNHYACTNSQLGRRFTTAFLAEYLPAGRTLTYINAGHNNPILMRTNGAVERLEAGGPPLGILDGFAYQSASTTLSSGDWLVIFTDGVVEAENDRTEEFGEGRLLQRLNYSRASATPAQLLQQLMTDLDIFVGTTPQHDDITCVLIKVL